MHPAGGGGPLAVFFLGLLMVIAVSGRPFLLRHVKVKNPHN
jgi:hypothetical protein